MRLLLCADLACFFAILPQKRILATHAGSNWTNSARYVGFLRTYRNLCAGVSIQHHVDDHSANLSSIPAVVLVVEFGSHNIDLPGPSSGDLVASPRAFSAVRISFL